MFLIFCRCIEAECIFFFLIGCIISLYRENIVKVEIIVFLCCGTKVISQNLAVVVGHISVRATRRSVLFGLRGLEELFKKRIDLALENFHGLEGIPNKDKAIYALKSHVLNVELVSALSPIFP